ncbi:hypothetical protein AEQU3_03217 [Aequorivita antarctica]|nr:hypothetical protein AEQU3_03217 [Aequorivita antarctica]
MKSSNSLIIVLYTEGLDFTGNTIEKQALGGSETAFIYVARELANLGHKVYAYCHCSEPGTYNGVIYNNLKEIKFWHTHSCDIFICSRYFFIFSQPIQAKVRLLWMHDILMPEMALELTKVSSSLDAVFCLSDFHCALTKRVLPKIAPFLQKSINGIDLELANEARASVKNKEHRIMFTSRPERGLMRTLEIYERLNDTSLELLICSYNSLEDPHVDRIEYNCNIKIKSLQNRGFLITRGCFTKEVLYQKIASSKLVLYPTDFPEIFCISAIEAQACGTIMLATDAFALKETLSNKKIPQDDYEKFYSETKKLIYNKSNRVEPERQGLLFVQTYTWDRVAAHFVAEALKHLEPTNLIEDITIIADTNHKMKGELPLISCLTLTKNRLGFLKQSIDCFCKQTYPNLELIIVNTGTRRYYDAINRYVQSLKRSDIFIFDTPANIPNLLGALRNFSLQQAKGELFCLWDDDDLYHPLRIEMQYRCLKDEQANVCFMTDHLHFFQYERDIHWVDWTRMHYKRSEEQWLPGSMMAEISSKFMYPESQHLGEDISYRDLVVSSAEHRVAALNGHGFLYVYRFHGGNAWSNEHHRNVTSWGDSSAQFLHNKNKLLKDILTHYPLPKPIKLKDLNGEHIYTYG